uniref:CDP-Glycerol:Poly(Glycerophosphate) glycerophosphotransferase n=1 Tax=Magnetococcus massalia (strain MO-1) TaxID=451514 RepID=A0A1S7LHQ1_MAGMO|nr:Protein of unknown function [Candidatus Magnetococcus massalia]
MEACYTKPLELSILMRVLALARHNNDIDFMTPVLDQLTCQEGIEIYYLLTSFELSVENDWRLRHLQSYPSVQVVSVWDILPKRFLDNLFKWLSSLPHSLGGVGWGKRKIYKIVSIYLRGRPWAERVQLFMESLSPSMVLCDWMNPLHNRAQKYPPYTYADIYQWSISHKVPCFSLPHGLMLFDLPRNNDFLFSDFFSITFVESEQRKKVLVGNGENPQKIIVSGAPRYDEKWISFTQSMAHRMPSFLKKDHFVIVFFATKLVYNYDFEKLLEWLLELGGSENVQLIVQPHPRGQKKSAFSPLFSHPSIIVDDQTPAMELIHHAQAVSTLVSSVVVDAIVQDKPVLYPKFLHDKVTRFEEAGACYQLNDMTETRAAVKQLQSGWKPLSTNRANFLRDTVFGAGRQQVVELILKELFQFCSKQQASPVHCDHSPDP